MNVKALLEDLIKVKSLMETDPEEAEEQLGLVISELSIMAVNREEQE